MKCYRLFLYKKEDMKMCLQNSIKQLFLNRLQ